MNDFSIVELSERENRNGRILVLAEVINLKTQVKMEDWVDVRQLSSIKALNELINWETESVNLFDQKNDLVIDKSDGIKSYAKERYSQHMEKKNEEKVVIVPKHLLNQKIEIELRKNFSHREDYEEGRLNALTKLTQWFNENVQLAMIGTTEREIFSYPILSSYLSDEIAKQLTSGENRQYRKGASDFLQTIQSFISVSSNKKKIAKMSDVKITDKDVEAMNLP